MTHLADVNLLVALVWSNHSAHRRARTWWAQLPKGEVLATCAITELGFARVSLQTAAAPDLPTVKRALVQVRQARDHIFLPDTLDLAALPTWVKTARHTTDGHLVALAAEHGAQLVTLDTGIPGAVLI